MNEQPKKPELPAISGGMFAFLAIGGFGSFCVGAGWYLATGNALAGIVGLGAFLCADAIIMGTRIEPYR